MREVENKLLETISADSPEEFQKLFNATFQKLKKYEPKVDKYFWGEKRCADFEYAVSEKIAETVGDDFMQHNARCTCSDCPFLEVGTDARRKWFPCPYADYGETRIDAAACETFYKEAVKRMREEAGR